MPASRFADFGRWALIKSITPDPAHHPWAPTWRQKSTLGIVARAVLGRTRIMAVASSRRARVLRSSFAPLLFAVAGCSHVAPYERGLLAHPTMTVEDISSGMEQHVRAVSEGPTGGLGGGGGGCGCN